MTTLNDFLKKKGKKKKQSQEDITKVEKTDEKDGLRELSLTEFSNGKKK